MATRQLLTAADTGAKSTDAGQLNESYKPDRRRDDQGIFQVEGSATLRGRCSSSAPWVDIVTLTDDAKVVALFPQMEAEATADSTDAWVSD